MRALPSWAGWVFLSALVAHVVFAGVPAGAPRRAHAQAPDLSPSSQAVPAAETTAEAGSGAALALTAPPQAECMAERFIVLTSVGFEPALAAEVRTDFATELRHRGLDVCDRESTTREPAALVAIEARDAVVVIELDDRVTHKRVARDLPLRSMPANGRALAIAIAIDELLRASWAELTLDRERSREAGDEDDSFVSEPATSTDAARPRPHVPLRYHLGVDLSYAHTARAYDAFGLDLRASLRPWGWGWFELSVGALGSLPAESARGDVIASGFRASLLAGACSRYDRPVFGCVGARFGLSVLMLRGLRPEMARAHTEPTAVVDGSAVGQLGVHLREKLYLFGEAGVGSVLQGVEATDGERTVMGVTGLLLSLQLGLGFSL